MDKRTTIGIALILTVAAVGVLVYKLSGSVSPSPPIKYRLSIGVRGSGSTNPAPGNYTYDKRTSIAVTATPSPHWILVYWSLDGVNASKTSTISVAMDSNHSLVAVFGISPPPLNVTVVYEKDPPRFDPGVLNITVGTTVEWINAGTEIHTTTSSNGTWNSGIMNVGDKFYYTFTSPGRYPYICAVHVPDMTGIIVVRLR